MTILQSSERTFDLTLQLDQHEVLCVMAALVTATVMLGDDPEGKFAEQLGKKMMCASIGDNEAMEVMWKEMFAKYQEVLTTRFKVGTN